MVIISGVLAFIALVAILVVVFLGDFKEAKQLYSNGNNLKAIDKQVICDEKVDFYKNELKRQELIIEELKRRVKHIENESGKEKQLNSAVDMLELARQKQILEQEKQIFQEKNKKLWNQSIAIHKEKDRIDILRKEIEEKHNEIVDSINYAKRIQTALVTSEEYLEQQLNDYFIFWKPRDVVSGDFYWAKQTSNGFLVVVSDCTGHGVPGAFMSLLGISFLNEITTRRPDIQPVELLEELRKMIKESLGQEADDWYTNKDGMDMACVLLNSEEKTIKFSGANNPMWLIRSGELIVYNAVKNPVGIFRKEKPFEQHLVEYKTDDIIFLFSDGFADQFGGVKNTKFKRQPFKNTLLELSGKKLKMKSLGNELGLVFEKWKGKCSQTDDVLVMGIRLQ